MEKLEVGEFLDGIIMATLNKAAQEAEAKENLSKKSVNIKINTPADIQEERRKRVKHIFTKLPTVYEFICELRKLHLDTLVETFDDDDQLNLVYINGFLSHSRRLKI